MDLLASFVEAALHLDRYVLTILQAYGMWVYAILFLIIFCETGLVVMPFLPGDSLLFVLGTLCGAGALQIEFILPLLMVASFAGDNTNYWIGRLAGSRLVAGTTPVLFDRKHLVKTQDFYKKHGGKTVVLARFLPVVRTFAPFVAGIGLMRYQLFVVFSAVGSIAWIGCFVFGGYFLGAMQVVKDNLTLATSAVIAISFVPALREFILHRMRRK